MLKQFVCSICILKLAGSSARLDGKSSSLLQIKTESLRLLRLQTEKAVDSPTHNRIVCVTTIHSQ